VAKYVGKYIGKHLGCRLEEDKGVRLVTYSKQFARKVSPRFDWLSPGADLWRLKLAHFAKAQGFTDANYRVRMIERFGSKWAYRLKDVISRLILPSYPSIRHWAKEFPEDIERCPEFWGVAGVDIIPLDITQVEKTMERALEEANKWKRFTWEERRKFAQDRRKMRKEQEDFIEHEECMHEIIKSYTNA
jgi:hypothetical protein